MSRLAFSLLLLVWFKLTSTCLMPEIVPKGMALFYTQEQWDQLRMKQQETFRLHGGCSQNENEVSCAIEIKENKESIGDCRMIRNKPTCYYVDHTLSAVPLMSFNHSRCAALLPKSSRSVQRRRNVVPSYLSNLEAKRRAKGVIPSNVDADGNPLPKIKCKMTYTVRESHSGKCVILRGNVYACRSRKKRFIHILHPVCRYLNETDTDRK